MKCPRCGYEAPKPELPPYEYTGYLQEHLVTILKLMRMGLSNNDIAENLRNLRGVTSYWGTAPIGTIGYIRRRYGLDNKKEQAGNHDRDLAIAAKYLAGGVTLQKLGDEYGLSRDRIRTIVIVAERKAAQREELERACQAAARIEDVPLEVLNLPARTSNCFKNDGYETVGDVLKLSDAEMLRNPNFGAVSLRSWKQTLEALRSEFAKPKD